MIVTVPVPIFLTEKSEPEPNPADKPEGSVTTTGEALLNVTSLVASRATKL